MGLDFGIDVKARTPRGAKYLANNFDHLERDYSDVTTFMFAYWRNEHGIRRSILNALEYKGYDGNGGEIILDTIEDLTNVVEVLKYYLNEAHWDPMNHNTDWYHAIVSIAETIYNLRSVIDDVENEEVELSDLRITLYDSY